MVHAGTLVLSLERLYMRKQASHDVLDSIGIIQARGLSSSHQSLDDYFEGESPVRLCTRRDMEWSHVAITFRLATLTVSSNDTADLARPSSSMSMVSSKCSRSFSLLSRFVFQEGLLTLPPHPVFPE